MSLTLDELRDHARELEERQAVLELRVDLIQYELEALSRDLANRRRRRWWRK